MRKINYPTSGIQYVGLSVMQELLSMSTVEIQVNPNVCVCVGGEYSPSGLISDKDVCLYF